MGAPQLIVPGTASGTGPVGGSGTAGTIPRWTGPSTLGDSVLVQVGSSIGVGMTSGFSGKLGVLSANALSTADVTFSYDATGSYRHGFSNVFSSTTAANNTSTWLVWNAAGGQTQVMTANGAGNVGFGTASPWAKLVAQGASDAGPTATVKGIAGVFTSTNVALSFGGYTAAPYGMWIQAHDYRSGVSAAFPLILNPLGGAIGASGISNPAANTIDISTSGWGLKLPATPGNADTQTLDCYQENTWSPTVTFGTGGTVTPTITSATYTRVGRVVHFNLVITYTVTAAPTGGDVTFTLPVATSGATAFGGGYCSNLGAGNVVGQVFFLAGSATSTVSVYKQAAVGVQSISTYVTANGTFYFSGTYQT